MNKERYQTLAESNTSMEMLSQNACKKEVAKTRLARWLPILLSISPSGLFLILLLFLLTGFASPVFAINLSAFWSYRQRGGEETDTVREFQQRYSLGLGTTLTSQPSHAITVSANLGYTRTQTYLPQGTFTTNTLTPSAQLSLVNDIFLSQISGSSTLHKNPSGDDSTLSSWDATLASRWDMPLWPTLRFNYSERIEPTDEGLRIFNFDGLKNTNSIMSLNWDLILAQFNYSYRISKIAADDSNSLAETKSHFARFETQGRFWDDRFNFNFSQQFNQFIQTISINDQGDGSFDFLLEGDTLSTTTDPDDPQDPTPLDPWTDEDFVLELNDGLMDGDFTTVAQTVPPESAPEEQRVHLDISFANEQQIDFLRLSLDSFTNDAAAASLQWDLYIRDSPDNTVWRLTAENIPTTYDSIRKRIEIPIDRFEEEIMVVAINETGVTLAFTELEAFNLFTEDFDSKTTGYLTNLGLGYRITRNLRANGSLTLDHTDTDNDDSNLENDRRTLNGNLRWTPLPFVTPSLSFSEYRQTPSSGPEDINRSYSLVVSTIPLPSMTVSFGATQNERYSDEQKTFFSNSYRLISRASIYPDLTASWNLVYTDSETLNSDDQFIGSTTLSSNLKFNAQLFQDLNTELTVNYSQNERDLDSTETADALLALRYRPSEFIAVNGSYKTSFLDNQSTDRLNLRLVLQLLNTHKTHLIVTAAHSRQDRTSNTFATVGSWDISRYFSLQTQGNFRIDEVKTYNFRVTLSMRM